MTQRLMDITDFVGRATILEEGRDYHNVREFSPEDVKTFSKSRGIVVTLLDRLESHYEQWQQFLPRVQVYYAVKAFNNPEVLRKLHSLGAKFEVASTKETEDCLRIGVKPDDILSTHPRKIEYQFESYRSLGVETLTIDSVEELEKTAKFYPGCGLMIRVISADAISKAKIFLDGKFGASTKEAKKLIAMALKMGFNVRGISFHIGSLPTDLTNHSRTIVKVRQLFDYSLSNFGHKMTVLNLGGGFKGAHLVKEFAIMAENINQALGEHFPEEEDIQVIAEPGTYFADGASDIYACVIGKRMHDIVEIPIIELNGEINSEAKDIIVETSNMEANGESYSGAEDGVADCNKKGIYYYLNDGIYGSLLMSMYVPDISLWYTLSNRNMSEIETGKKLYPSKFWGPSCDSLDVLSETVMVPELDEGTWLVRKNSGAYSLDLQCRFNSLPPPLHIVVNSQSEQ